MDLLLDQFLNCLLVERGLSLNTLDAYSRDLHKYLDYLLAQGIKDIAATLPVRQLFDDAHPLLVSNL